MALPDRTAPQPLAATPILDALVGQIAKLAQQMGIASLVIVGRDPKTKATKLYGSPAAIDDLRELTAEKFKLFDGGETSWGES